jgi:hypothetical protein
MKITFVGNMQSGFIEMDKQILSEYNAVFVFDISKYALSLEDSFWFVVDVIKNIRSIISSRLTWIWFADYHAIPFILISKLTRTPVIICHGDYEVTSDPENNYGNQRSFIRGALTRWVMRNATACVMPSPMYEIVAKSVEPKVNVITIPCAIDIPEETYKKESLVITSTVSEGSRIRKGIPLFEEIAKTIDGCEMKVLIGVPREEYIDNLKRAKVYCQLSSHESFGVSLVESMSYGCVPVTSDRGSLPWVSGGTGVVVPFGDVEQTKIAIKKALTMDGNTAREHIKKFSIAHRKEMINKLIRQRV